VVDFMKGGSCVEVDLWACEATASRRMGLMHVISSGKELERRGRGGACCM
jgi:hypothetical protein